MIPAWFHVNWMTEWGRFGVEGIEEFESEVSIIPILAILPIPSLMVHLPFSSCWKMTDYEAGVGSAHLADPDYMIKHNFLSKTTG